MKPFIFKQFKISQDKTAMKVGTDGVLLGAWADCSTAHSILDIGTGTGLIALMMAQKNLDSEIVAIEIDSQAAMQATGNIQNSAWKNRITVVNKSLQDFSSENKFDLIVSNPPFFNNSFQSENNARNKARQTETLDFETLLSNTASLLSKKGKACFILSYLEFENFTFIAKQNALFTNKILFVKGNIKTAIKRFMIELSFQETTIQEETIIIEKSRHNYTEDYIDLVQDFYFKM